MRALVWWPAGIAVVAWSGDIYGAWAIILIGYLAGFMVQVLAWFAALPLFILWEHFHRVDGGPGGPSTRRIGSR